MAKGKLPPLCEQDVGAYGELCARPNSAGLVLVFTPSLAALLAHAERVKKSPLSPTEVVRIRDNAPAVAVTAAQAAALEESRGYADVNPAEPYESWVRMNAE